MAAPGESIRNVVITTFETNGAPATVTAIDTVRGATDGLTKTTIKSGEATNGVAGATKRAEIVSTKYIDTTKQNEMAQRQFSKSIHMANMAILGMNMSVLGLSFQMQNLTFVSDETKKAFQSFAAPLQMIFSFMNMGMSIASLLTMQISMLSVAITSLGLGTLILVMAWATWKTQAMGMKIVLGALTGALIGLAAAYLAIFVYKSANLALASAGAALPKILAAVGAGALGGALLAGAGASLKAKERAFSGAMIQSPTSIMAGEVPEAIIPLQSPRASRMMSGSGVNIGNATFVIKADSPAQFYRELNKSIGNRSYVKPVISR